MKKDINGRITRVTRRTLNAFLDAMLELLAERPFTDISVNALCERAGYPRATFYNYFDDRDDVLDYCWTALSRQADLADLMSVESSRRVDAALDAMADLLESNADLLRAVTDLNPPESPLYTNLRMFVESQTHMVMRSCVDHERLGLPADLLADHYANTMMLVLDWAYLRGHALTRKQLHDYAHTLLGGVEGAEDEGDAAGAESAA